MKYRYVETALPGVVRACGLTVIASAPVQTACIYILLASFNIKTAFSAAAIGFTTAFTLSCIVCRDSRSADSDNLLYQPNKRDRIAHQLNVVSGAKLALRDAAVASYKSLPVMEIFIPWNFDFLPI